MKTILSLAFALMCYVSNAQSISKQDETAITSQLRLMEDYFRANKLLSLAEIYLDNAYLISPGESLTGRKAIILCRFGLIQLFILTEVKNAKFGFLRFLNTYQPIS